MNSTVLSHPRFDLYRTVTDKIVAAIEAGAGEFILPWHRTGSCIGRPTNAATGMSYRGINVVALWAESTMTGYLSGHWASYRQWQGLGAQVRKGETGSTIVFFGALDKDEDAKGGETEDETRRRFVARSSRVFNSEQVDGWEAPVPAPLATVDVIASVEHFVARTKARVRHGGESAFYQLKEDVIVMPERNRFHGSPTSTPTEAYYATLLHELTHWSGASHRLDREHGRKFGDSAYAMEELVADLGSAFLCADLGISSEPRPDHAAYLSSWLTLMKQDARIIFTTARLANQASDYLHELVAQTANI